MCQPGTIHKDGTVNYVHTTAQATVTAVYPGKVYSKSNYRVGQKDQSRWLEHKNYQRNVAAVLRAARGVDWNRDTSTKSVKERPIIAAALHARCLLDTGNVSKSVLDAAEGILMENDAEIRALIETTERSGNNQCLWMVFAQYPAGTALADITEDLSRLHKQLLDQIADGTL